MRLTVSPSSLEDYRRFLQIKRLPQYSVRGRTLEFPDEYATKLGLAGADERTLRYKPLDGLFDYQRDISALAIRKERFAVFADCGLGKTLVFTEFARHAVKHIGGGKAILIVSPLMVIPQTLREVERFYGTGLPIDQVSAANLSQWLEGGRSKIGITNYEALRSETPRGRLAGLILDESSMLKSHYGKWGRVAIRLGRGLRWKLALTGTPAPNDRIEYANHAVFCDQFTTVNAFLARFFVNRGQTDNRWELKPHALTPFYRALSHWCIFLTNPATYGWRDNTEGIPPIHVHIDRVELTAQQQALVYEKTGSLFAHKAGGITSRSILAQIAKGHYRGQQIDTNKPAHIRRMIESWPDESTLIWCLYNREQERIAAELPEAASITGETPDDERQRIIDEFKAGRQRVLISKPKILGFGLNLQIATRQIFSGLQDSYESFYQAVKRSNRYGSTKPLNVHIPVTDIERPMIETVLAKANRVQRDTEEQERIFRDASFRK